MPGYDGRWSRVGFRSQRPPRDHQCQHQQRRRQQARRTRELPTDDPLFGKGPLRAAGRRIIPAYLFEVKKPEESKYPWDYYKQIATISPEDAAKPLEASDCPLVKK